MLEIDGHHLTLEDIGTVSRGEQPVRLSAQAARQLKESRAVVELALREGRTVYGVTTGFGDLARIAIPPEDRELLQEKLLTNHAAGVGEILPDDVVRAMLLLRANALAKGHSGVRIELVERLLTWLREDCLPVVPSQGSVGASGDLAPLAHLALPLLGLGEMRLRGTRMPTAQAQAAIGLGSMTLQAKEGLALTNGTQLMASIGSLGLLESQTLLDTADVVASLTAQALRGIPDAYAEQIVRARPHPGAIETAAHLRTLLAGSRLTTSPGQLRMQDAYSIRCIPQVHGAARQVASHVRGVLEIEINSATDNPLVFPDDGTVVSGGNFHGEPLAVALDYLAIGLAEMASISERRIERMVNPALSGLPPFLTNAQGTSSGMMIAQYTAAALVSHNKVLAHPASVDSIPTSANQEDIVSMGSIGALKLRDVLRQSWQVLGIELVAACQALDFVGPEHLSPATRRVHQMVRDSLPHYEDTVLSLDLNMGAALCRAGDVLTASREGSES
ncbi:MAG: histidine ammonia-lyase [Thermaerobacter sp.]|nr:histidine ammonia-lyase [Thermaerobacter sp.]